MNIMDVYEKLSHPVALTIFVATLLLPIAIGFITLRRTRSQSDFFVGGRDGTVIVARPWCERNGIHDGCIGCVGDRGVHDC